jgi:hypothetical protein
MLGINPTVPVIVPAPPFNPHQLNYGVSDSESDEDDDPTIYRIYDIQERWGVRLRHYHRGSETLPLTMVQQIDRFLLPREYDYNIHNETDNTIHERRIRNLGSEELGVLIQGIQSDVIPRANTRLMIMYGDNYYDTYAELADAMGIPELQVANFDEAPFMTSLLSPGARHEYVQHHAIALRKPKRKTKRPKRVRKMTKRKKNNIL